MAKTFYMIGANGEAFTTSNPEWHKNAESVSYKRYAVAREAHCRKMLLRHLKPGSKVYTKVNHVARSGMSRSISVYIVTKPDKKRGEKEPSIWNISGYLADLAGLSRDKNELAVIKHGCGMDMAWDCVYNLGEALWPKGTPKPHGTRNGEPDSAGGYALKHQSL